MLVNLMKFSEKSPSQKLISSIKTFVDENAYSFKDVMRSYHEKAFLKNLINF